MTVSRRLAALALVFASAIANTPTMAASAAAGAGIAINEAKGGRFPDKTLLLTLPDRRPLTTGDLRVSENGVDVQRLAVTPGNAAGAQSFGVVLAIDTSQSMRGEAIADAMKAAQAFARQRPPQQKLGIVFFNHGARVALAPTTDTKRIDSVLASAPALFRGTRIFDATSTSLQLLDRSRVSVGSVIVLSDGADVGSQASAAAVTGAARKTRTRIFTVGLRSPSYNARTLRGLASGGGGTYAEASSSSHLSRIFDALGKRFGNEFLVTYRSLAPLGHKVTVDVAVNGVAGTATTTYQAPDLARATGPKTEEATGWTSNAVALAVCFVIAVLIFLAVLVIVRPRRGTVRSRIAGFVAGDDDEPPDPTGPRAATAVFAGAERSLAGSKRWEAFEEDMDVARMDLAPIRVAATAVTVTAIAAWFSAAIAGNPVLAVMSLGIPVLVVLYVRFKADKQRRAFEEQLGDNLQVIASAMRAGQSFVGALAIAVDDAAEPSRTELRRVVADEQLGIPLDEAISRVSRRMRSTEFEYVGLVAHLQRETGGNTAEVVDRVTETIRERSDIRRMIRTLTAQGRLAGGVVSLLPVALMAIISVVHPHYVDPLIHTSLGRTLLTLAGGLILVGWLAIRRIVDVKV